MTIKPIYEFLLWDNCNNHCKFCFQRKNGIICDKHHKIRSLKCVIDFLNSDEYIHGSHILLVGGEIFDESNFSIIDDYIKFIEIIIDKMNSNIIDLLYINTNLLYKNMSILNKLLSFIDYDNLWDRLKFTTSYDLEGRFSTKEKETLFLTNLKCVKNTYPKCNIVVNTILTKQTCEKILNNEFNPKDFCDEYNCDINLIPYIVYTKELSATREQIFKTLLKTNELIHGYFKRYTDNMSLAQDKLLYKFNNEHLEFVSSENLICGHSENFKRYADSNTCFICDLKQVYNMLGE